MTILPPLPKIEGDTDIILDIYTRGAVCNGGSLPNTNNDYGDTARLAELGEKVIELVLTAHFFNRRPSLTAEEITEQKIAALSDDNLRTWMTAYNVPSKLRFAPGEEYPAEVIRNFFNGYSGALFIRNGFATVQEWISRLVDPDSEIAPMADGSQSHPPPPVHNSNPWGFSPPQPTSPGPPPPNMPLTSSVPIGGYPNNHNAHSWNLISLALVNQTAVQKGFAITYAAESTGLSHMPTWTVKCSLNGKEMGTGIGKNQKVAKEEAARQVWATMQWG